MKSTRLVQRAGIVGRGAVRVRVVRREYSSVVSLQLGIHQRPLFQTEANSRVDVSAVRVVVLVVIDIAGECTVQ